MTSIPLISISNSPKKQMSVCIETRLIDACRVGNLETVKELFKSCKELSRDILSSMVFAAIFKQNLELIDYLFWEGVEFDFAFFFDTDVRASLNYVGEDTLFHVIDLHLEKYGIEWGLTSDHQPIREYTKKLQEGSNRNGL